MGDHHYEGRRCLERSGFVCTEFIDYAPSFQRNPLFPTDVARRINNANPTVRIRAMVQAG